ncbi:MAG TPA: regulatory protein RecX [Chitinophagaceae bacterium]|nr:regulatory protein RecX [Chitinophagaceae bacterium]
MQKIRLYCGYQERSHKEVKEKLYSYKLRKQTVEEIVSQLIEEGYLDEERFAVQYAGGKFRIKQWGRVKIVQALKQKGVSQYCIAKAINDIDESLYRKVLQKLADRKWTALKKESHLLTRLQKTRTYLLQKGYESGPVRLALKQLCEKI